MCRRLRRFHLEIEPVHAFCFYIDSFCSQARIASGSPSGSALLLPGHPVFIIQTRAVQRSDQNRPSSYSRLQCNHPIHSSEYWMKTELRFPFSVFWGVPAPTLKCVNWMGLPSIDMMIPGVFRQLGLTKPFFAIGTPGGLGSAVF